MFWTTTHFPADGTGASKTMCGRPSRRFAENPDNVDCDKCLHRLARVAILLSLRFTSEGKSDVVFEVFDKAMDLIPLDGAEAGHALGK